MKTRMILICCLLSACGGGGSGDSTPAAAVPEAGELASPLARPGDDAVTETDEPEEAPQDIAATEFDAGGYLPPGAAPAPALLAQAATARRLYVSPKGTDSGPGTAERPWRTIARAARAAKPGTVVMVAPGNYSGGFRTSASGKGGERITFVSTRKWGARITPPRNSRNKTAWDNRGDYVDIVGFEIDGSGHQGGVRWMHGIYSGGSHSTIRNNRVHHIARHAPCTGAGGAAIGVDSYYGGVQARVIANLVHDIGPAGCRFVQGIYVSTTGQVSNNVVMRVAEGGIHLWHDARDVIISNNTVVDNNTGIIVGGGDYYHSRGPNDDTRVFSNIVVGNKMGISEQGQTGRRNRYRNNLVYGNASYDWRLKNQLRHYGTVSAPPMFAAGSPYLKPAPGSPAVGRGSDALAEPQDFEGWPRNSQTGFDIGASQH